jgi:hypothetical protein
MDSAIEFAIFVNSGKGTTETAPGYLVGIPKLIKDSVEFNI